MMEVEMAVEMAVEKAMRFFRGNSNLIALEDLTKKAQKFGFPGDVNAMRLFFELHDRYKIKSIPDHQNQSSWFVYERPENCLPESARSNHQA